LAAQTPHIGTHSFVVLGLMALGIAALAAIMLHAFRENYFPAETLLLAFYLIGYSAQPLAVQRYVEPPILLTFATFAARLPKARGEFDLVPLGLALIYATLTTLHNTEILGSVSRSIDERDRAKDRATLDCTIEKAAGLPRRL
jgi:hypothetical protein